MRWRLILFGLVVLGLIGGAIHLAHYADSNAPEPTEIRIEVPYET